jgi:hypothetical protein
MLPWATKRQLMYAGGVALFVLAVVALVSLVFFYKPPSCSDGVMNQKEEGIDCGGECTHLCQAPRVSALWARSVKVAPGVYHAVAMVKNPESNAGSLRLPYTFSLYSAENTLIAERDGVMVLEPGEIVPLFEPNVITGERTPARTFLTFHQGVWEKMERTPVPISIDSEFLDQNNLTLSARISNVNPTAVERAILTALLYDSADVLVAASQTVLTELPPRGQKQVTFTWQEPFIPPVARVVITSRLR